MNQHKSMHFYACPPQRISTFLLIASAFFCVLSGFIVASPVAQAQGMPGGNVTNPVVSAVDIAEPAVVRIITKVPGRLTVNFTTGSSATFPQDGATYPLAISGSGAFISANGDIATADHVVHPPQADMTDYLYQIAAPDIANYLNTTYGVNPPYDGDQIYNALATGTFRSEPQFETPSSQIYLSAAYTGPLSAKTFNTVPLEYHAPIDKIERESPPEKQDLAIIHVHMDNTPSILLDDSNGVSQQDELTIIGFPGNADISERQDPTQLLTASVNKVYVSAIKRDDDGTSLIQVSGNVEHGDSGGPALDSQGNIVGIVSFQKDSMGQPNSTSFLQVSENVKQMISALKLNTTPGKFQQAWQQSFRDYTSTSAGHWHKAVADFTALAHDYPGFKAIKPFSDYAQAQAKGESVPQSATKSGGSSMLYLLIGLGIILLLVIGVAIFKLMQRKSPYANLLNVQANGAMANRSTPTSAYSNLSLPASTSQPIAPLTPWEQQIADSSTWKPATSPTFREQPYVNPTPWSSPTTPPSAPAYASNGTTGEIKRPVPFVNELPVAWSSEDAIIVDPLPSAASQANSKTEDITNKREAIQKEQNRRRMPGVPRQDSQQSALPGNTGAQAAFDWPLPATWQQVPNPPQEARKNPAQNPPQGGFGGPSNFDFNRGRQ